MKQLDRSKISDEVTNRVCRALDEAVTELQNLTGIRRVVIRNVRLDGTTLNTPTNVPHGLGRAPLMVTISAARVAPADIASLTAGMVVDAGSKMFNGSPLDRSTMIQLGAFGYGVPIIVDVEVS